MVLCLKAGLNSPVAAAAWLMGGLDHHDFYLQTSFAPPHLDSLHQIWVRVEI
jgi:hypothetical protein